MAEALIVYGTSEGHTATIAARIGERMTAAGLRVQVHPIDRAPEDLSLFDLVVVGASIHMDKHQPEVVAFALTNLAELTRAHSGFFSVSMTASEHTSEAEEHAKGYVDVFVTETGWEPELIALFGGALAYTQYGFVKKRMVRTIAKQHALGTDISRDYDYTDWDDVDHFADGCVALVNGPS